VSSERDMREGSRRVVEMGHCFEGRKGERASSEAMGEGGAEGGKKEGGRVKKRGETGRKKEEDAPSSTSQTSSNSLPQTCTASSPAHTRSSSQS
jgi:hypothetical protein